MEVVVRRAPLWGYRGQPDPIYYFDLPIDKVKIHQPGHFAQHVIAAHSFVEIDSRVKQ